MIIIIIIIAIKIIKRLRRRQRKETIKLYTFYREKRTYGAGFTPSPVMPGPRAAHFVRIRFDIYYYCLLVFIITCFVYHYY